MLRHYRRGRSVEEEQDVAFVAEGDFEDAGGVVENAEDADDRRWIDRLAESFVVEADVAASDGRAEGSAGFGEAVDGFAELPHHFGLFGAAEVEAIRGGDGTRPAGGHVAGGFGNGVHRADAGIQLAPAAIAVGGKREGALHGASLRILDAHDGGIARAGAGERVGAYAGVVLLGDPTFGGDGGRRQQLHEIRGEIRAFGGKGKPICCRLIPRRRRGDGAIVDGSFFGEGMRGNFRSDATIVVDAGDAAFGDLADDDSVEAPLLENRKDFVLAAFFGDEEHALLRFAEHDFVRRHAGFALGNFGEIDFDAGAAAGSHFHGGAGEPGGAHVLNRHDRAGLHGFETGFEEELLHERVADLHVGALLLGLLGEFGGGQERCAVNSVAAGFCAGVNHGIADAFGFGEKDFFFFGDAEGERVDERVLRIARLESDFAADSRNAETISVTADAANDTIEDAAVGGNFRAKWRVASREGPDKTIGRDRTETERIQHRDWTGAHGENVAQDATDARGRALEGFNVTGMIMRFDFEGRDQAVANVHNASVFAGALHNKLAARGQALQVDFARFVGAVLAPHHGENA